MNNELYLKLFFIETYNSENMYYEYLKGQVALDNDLLNKWLREIEIRNYTFAQSLNDFNRFSIRNLIVESALSDEICISKKFFYKRERIISEFGKFKISHKIIGDSHNHYICNGYFLNTLEQIYKVLDNGSFTVGICAEKKTNLYQDVVKHYEKLRKFLLNNGYHASSLETNCGRKNRVYLLMYDAPLKRR